MGGNDEREQTLNQLLTEMMQETLKVIRKADKDFKVSLAGTYHKELLDDLNDYCITIAEKFAPEEIEARRKAVLLPQATVRCGV